MKTRKVDMTSSIYLLATARPFQKVLEKVRWNVMFAVDLKRDETYFRMYYEKAIRT